MKIAFYAPMKSPLSTQPSGDRTIGRLLMIALRHAGLDVRLASSLRTWTSAPDAERLGEHERAGHAEALAFLRSLDATADAWRPDVWFTYHVHYKAPDFVGHNVADALGIPYVLAEASYAARRAEGEWADWLQAARVGIERADAILSFTARDKIGLSAICRAEKLFDLKPFIDLDGFPSRVVPRAAARDEAVRLVTVAMMRPGAKLASYELLGAALRQLGRCKWHLDVVGDGRARDSVRAAFAGLTPGSVTWHEEQDAASIRRLLEEADLFVWPGVDEAFGMAYLEAQASGLPVAAVRNAGVPEVVRHGETGLLAEAATPDAFADCLRRLIDDAALRQVLGTGARAAVEQDHSITAASETLRRVLRSVTARQ